MDKVKLPREVAEALDEYRGTYEGYEWMVIAGIVRDPEEKQSHWEVVLRDFAKESKPQFMKILQALVNGYEVEQTPEDKVREYYNSLSGTGSFVDTFIQQRKSIRTTLELLNIKIEGVSA